jgi:poly-gamma-glutamate capsule biosynthesis protein CapA/YwtB (metallophosphatase superfamily)
LTRAARLLAARAIGALRFAGTAPAPDEPVRVELADGNGVLLFGGDVAHGESYPGGPARLARTGWAQGFSRLAPLLESAQGAVLNLETPLTEPGPAPLDGRKPRVHWGHREEVPRLLRACGVAAVSLANNHSMDHGPAGLQDTLSTLAAQGVASFGAGPAAAAAARPLLLTASVAGRTRECIVFAGFQYFPGYDFCYRFYARGRHPGVDPLRPRLMAARIARAREEYPSARIVVFPHWGYDWGPAPRWQRRIARRWIDAGADLVLGHGPHEVQGVERYRDRWIFHSIGSFMFQVPNPPAMPGGLAVRLELAGPRLEIIPLSGAGEDGSSAPRPFTRDECRRLPVTADLADLRAHGRPLEEKDLAGWEVA